LTFPFGIKLRPPEIIKNQTKKSGVFQLASIVRLGWEMPELLKIFFPTRTLIQTINIEIMVIKEGKIIVKPVVILS
jgi:hypothetical protein